jgi:ParB family chromosome partitioning protein
MTKPALGRGLGALLGGVPAVARAAVPPALPTVPTPPVTPAAPAPAAVPLNAAPDTRERVERVAIARVKPCPFQPRKDFTPAALQELADSIKAQGIVQPLIVRSKGDHYELIAGERRWRAAQLVGLTEVPVVVREADDRQVLELALIENLQRENLNAIEEAQGYSQLIEQFQLSQEEAAVKVGKSRAAVANSLRLLKLASDIQSHIREGRLSVGHAKVILGLTRPEHQKLAVDKILREGLNVRQAEDLVARLQAASAAAPAHRNGKAPLKDAHVLALEEKLKQRLATKVALRYRQGKGALEIRFASDDELERVLELLGVKLD